MDSVLLPLIHKHPMIPLNDMRKGNCFGRFEATSDGYYCTRRDFFFHKKCCEDSSESIQHPSHPDHTLRLVSKSGYSCNVCGMGIKDLFYNCEICGFDIDLFCAKYQTPEVIDFSEIHHHKLTLHEEYINFDCAKCGNDGTGFQYKCQECDLVFHVKCVWHPQELKHPLEVNHSYHSLHPLNLHTNGQLPDYSDGTCSLCASKIDDRLFYHCSFCNFTLDMHCVLHPPIKSLLHLKAHDHQLTLLQRLDSFICNACGLKGVRSRYVCFQCGFMIHQECLCLPHIININRHDHRVSRTPVLGIVNSMCGVCRKKVDWTYGGFSCQRCHDNIVHSKCATRKDVWNGKELEGVPEEKEDTEPYVIINDYTIQHFSHKEHHLRLHVNDVICDKRCRACTHPISLQSFYGCVECDFILHQNCAGLLKLKRHFLHNDRLTLDTNKKADRFWCDTCYRWCNGFKYQDGNVELDVRCATISEPFFHSSHPDHPLYHMFSSDGEGKTYNGCKKKGFRSVMRCIKLNCEFVLCLDCATLPLVVKHRVDDHPLSLCYGEEASGKYWCDICEKEIDSKEWFYICKDQRASLHTKCVVGDFSNLMPRRTFRKENTNYEVVLNNSVSRPICKECKLHCIYPIILKELETSDEYICSLKCSKYWY